MLSSLFATLTKRRGKELELEIGKIYLTRDGHHVEITAETSFDERCSRLDGKSAAYEFKDSNGRQYTRNGRFFRDAESHRDIVAPVH